MQLASDMISTATKYLFDRWSQAPHRPTDPLSVVRHDGYSRYAHYADIKGKKDNHHDAREAVDHVFYSECWPPTMIRYIPHGERRKP